MTVEEQVDESAGYRQYAIEEYHPHVEPYYVPTGDEISLFEAAFASKIPVLLKGPTGCGKTRFVEYMAWKLGRPLTVVKDRGATDKAAGNGVTQALPLVTVACHEDLTASDLVGRYLLEGESTRWIDGPLTRAVKAGAICYLDEVVEAREGFLLVISYNPGYQSALKDLKHSTRQRFISLEFYHPKKELEAKIIAHESGVSEETAQDLAKLGEKVRNLREHGLSEGVSTRLLVYTGKLIQKGIAPRRACQVGVVWALTDDAEVQRSIEEVASSIFE